MPYVSAAQRGYMHAAAERGEIPRKVVEEFDKASKGQKNLPEHVRRKKGSDLVGRHMGKRKSNLTGNPGY